MNIRIITVVALTASIILSASCSKETGVSGQGDGCLSLKIETLGTKAALSSEELLAQAKVKIYKADFSGKVREYTYSEMPQTLYLPADSYRIDVAAGELAKSHPAPASWEQQSYKGSQNVTIIASKTASTTVEAKVCNAISNISFDSSIAEQFQAGYSCTIGLSTSNAAEQLTYDASKSETDGYFIADGFEPSLYWTFSGQLAKDGSTLSKSGEIPTVEPGKRYTLTLKYSQKDGILKVNLEVDDSTNDIYHDIIFVPVSTGVSPMSRFDVWAGHFTARADVDEGEYDAENVFFEYKATNSDSWSKTAKATRESEGSFYAVISGLNPSSEYEYRLVVKSLQSGSEEYLNAPAAVTTDAAPQVPNAGFETTSKAESSKYFSFYDPASPTPSLQTKWWGNGNRGSTTVGSSSVICYPVTDDYKEGSQSVCLQSRYVIIKFAAGNLFSGHFGEVLGTSGGTVFFGRPFTSRPTAMRLWVKYSADKINRTTSATPSGVSTSDYDKASLRVALGTWDYKRYGGDADSPILVNTNDTSTFVDFSNDDSTIAFGELLISGNDSNYSDWKQVTIPIDYNITNKYPTHIVISFAASMYGDYFTGYDDSHLWLDGIELLYQ